VVAMAPAVGALVGGGVVAMWRARERFPWAGIVLGLAMVGSAGVAMMLLDRTPSFVPGFGLAVVAVTALTVPVLAVRASARTHKFAVAAAGLGLAMLLAGPMAYAVDTMQTAYSGGTPAAGPTTNDSGSFGGPGGGQAGGGAPSGTGASNATFARAGGPGGTSLSSDTIAYLEASQGSATWLLAVSDSTTAGQLELTTGRAVMSTGGFTGSDNALSLSALEADVASGQLRFILLGGQGGGPGGGQSASSEISSWVTSMCTAVTVNGTATSVYDCSAAVTASTSATGG